MGRHRATIAAALVVTMAVAVGVAHAQRYFREGSYATRLAPPQMPDASFVVCRLAYRSVRAEPSGIGWQTDYPYAEINLTTRLSELTKTRVSRDGNQRPNFYVVRPLDATLFNCPFIVASDAGTIGFRDDEAEQLRAYLLKGGFFWADDFWGSEAWDQWASQIGRVLPPDQYPIEDVALDDPLLHSLFDIKSIPQITNIQFWRRYRRHGDVGAWQRQRGRAPAGDSRQPSPDHGPDDAQHRRRRLVGARG